MATTTNYGWTTPDDTALVKDGAAAIRTLGSSVDTTTKALNPSTTLGDIEYRSSTANTNTRLGIGSPGNVLPVAGGVPSWAAPAAATAMTLINTGGTTLTGSSVSISSIPSTYNHLQLIVVAYKPASQVSLLARFNNDSNTRYVTRTGTGSNDFSSVAFTESSFKIQNDDDDSTATGISVTDVFYYANTSIWKMAHTLFIGNHPAVPADVRGNRFFGIYNQTTAIDRIDLFPSSGNFTSGTAYLYGIK